VFLRFATAFVRSRQNCFGSYNQEDDSFTFPVMGSNLAGNLSNDPPEFDSVDSFGALNGDLVPMSAFLGSCLGENQAMNGLWNMDFSQPGPF
jgi:hypothetical protein